jgi:hypothetical protein
MRKVVLWWLLVVLCALLIMEIQMRHGACPWVHFQSTETMTADMYLKRCDILLVGNEQLIMT